MKKRYMFTLTQENVEEFQKLTREVGLPPSTLSRAVDDFIRDINQIMKKAKAKGKFTIRDIFTMMGEQIELIQRDQDIQLFPDLNQEHKIQIFPEDENVKEFQEETEGGTED